MRRVLRRFDIPLIVNTGIEEYDRHIEMCLEHKPNIIIDDGADLVSMIHEKRPDLAEEVWGGCEETTTGIIRLKALDREGLLKSSHAQVVIVILFLWKNLGYNMILFMAALGSIPKDILEVAILESATPFQIFWHIKIRYLSSTILFVTIMSLINSFKVFREIYLLTGNYPYDTIYMMQHFMNNAFAQLDYQKLSAAAIMMSIVMVIIIGILFLTENYFGRDVEG